MTSQSNTFSSQIDQLSSKEDLDGLNQLVSTLTTAQRHQYKERLTEAYLCIFSVWYFDWICNKIKIDDPAEFLPFLLDILQSAQQLDPDLNLNAQRAECYTFLAEESTQNTVKLHYFDKAIEAYTKALANPENLNIQANLANTLLNRLAVTEQFEDIHFTQILARFENAFAVYSDYVLSSFLHDSFWILTLSFERKEYWHSQFLTRFTALATNFAQKDPIIYLAWFNNLTHISENIFYKNSPTYPFQLSQSVLSLLTFLTHYETDNPELINQLGKAFEKAAKSLEDSNEKKLILYETALQYFTRGQEINPAAWTFPVYATNILQEMAKLYHTQGDISKVIEVFEEGLQIFSQKVGQEFTSSLYSGHFLMQYARLAYQFNAPSILKKAEKQFLIARELGQNYYSSPFLGLAKVALKSGNRQKCLDILQECQAIFTTPYSKYSFDEVLSDEDFKEIREDTFFQN